MRTGTLVLFSLLLMATMVPSGSSSLAAPDCDPSHVIFVAGKGTIDSCTGAHPELSRIYPRKPGIPPNGCAPECPALEEAPETNSEPAPSMPAPAATPTPVVLPSVENPPPAQNCDRVSYPDVCIPFAPPYLSCSDIPDRNFRVRAPDAHRFDADGNGIGCEQVAGPSIGR
jgi:hypothetical protein